MTHCKTKNKGQLFNVYGWIRPEPLTQWISAWGGSFHETLLSNLSWHHVYPADTAFRYERPSTVQKEKIKPEDKTYVLFIGSEGDAGNWNFGFQSGAWLSSQRGNVPVGWGFNFHFFELFPFVGQYYYKTAKANDGFIAVTSPLGYAYHDMFPPEVTEDAKNKAKYLLGKYNIPAVYAYKHYNGAGVSQYRGITISNNYNFHKLGQFAEETGTELTFLFDPGLQTQKLYRNFGGLLYNHVDDQTFYANTTNSAAVAERIIQKIRTLGTGPSFLLAGYQRLRSDETVVNANNPADLTLPQLQNIMNAVINDPVVGKKTEFVTPEKFAALLQSTTNTTATSMTEQEPQRPAMYKISSHQMKVDFSPATYADRVLTLFDLTGRKLAQQKSGHHEVIFDLQAETVKQLILQVTDQRGVRSYLFVP